MTVRIGCAEIPGGVLKKRYFESFNFIERSDTFFNLPATATCTRWRQGLSPEVTTSIVAWQPITHDPHDGYPRLQKALPETQLREAGLLGDTPFVREAVEKTLTCARALNATAVVFQTPATFSPSAYHRERLLSFFQNVATSKQFEPIVRVWQPQGLWETAASASLARDAGVCLACDPIAIDPLGEPMQFYYDLDMPAVYFRIAGLGQKRGTSQTSLRELANLSSRFDDAWVVFTGPDRYRQALAFKRIDPAQTHA